MTAQDQADGLGDLRGYGVVIGSTDPERLLAWYRAALEPLGAQWNEHLLVVGPQAFIGFDQRDDVGSTAVEPGRHLINVSVRDVRAAEAHLNTLGVTWVRPVEETESGWFFSTVQDPDGNFLQFLQAPAGFGS